MTNPFSVVCDLSDRERWLKERLTGLGSSDSSILVLGRRYERTPLDLYLEKVGMAKHAPENELIHWGQEMERIVAARYATEVAGAPCRKNEKLLRSMEWPFLLATVDYWLPEFLGPLEIKTSGTIWDGVPRAVWVQVQHQLAVTGHEGGAVAVMAGGPGGLRFFHREIARDEEFIREELVPLCSEFWRCVMEREAPAPSEHDSRALKRLYPDPDPEVVVTLDGEWTRVDEALVDAKRRAKEASDEAAQLENRIKAEMGEAGSAVLPSGVQYAWSKGKARRLIRREPK